MKTSLNRNLLIGFSLSLLILLISSAAAYISIQNLLRSAESVNHSNSVTLETEKALSTMKDAETGQRGFLLTNDELFLQPYNGSFNKVKASIEKVKALNPDNSVQQANISLLSDIVDRRFSALALLIDHKRANEEIDIRDLRKGKAFMDSIRSMVKIITTEEQKTLMDKTKELNKFTAYTPVFIIIAAVLSLLITVFFYLKVKGDIIEKVKLQENLFTRDIETGKRIDIIKNLAEKISNGHYTIRLENNEQDSLGNLAVSLNKMAASLESSFKKLSDKEWLQKGIAQLNETMMGNNNLQNLTAKIIDFIVLYTDSFVGAFYLLNSDNILMLQNGFALDQNKFNDKIKLGEGLIGQCALTKKEILVTNIDQTSIKISFASAELKPSAIIILPVLFENNVTGIIELGALHQYTERELLFLKSIVDNIGTAINIEQNRKRLQDLLEETQVQSEELMTQHAELEHMNAELEAQSQQLQSSEEELKVQQEELTEYNAALEERNKLVQQKNIEIQKRVKELASATKYKSEFLANMSHELRTPLNSILLLSRLLEDNINKRLSADQVKYAQVIQSSGNGLLKLIDEILDLSKIESGKMTVENIEVKVDDIIKEMTLLFDPLAQQKNIEWKIETNKDIPKILETDKMRLEQILKNLLSNAFKFTQKGHVHLLISCADHNRNSIQFQVKDSGFGIAEDKKEIIFDAFQQEDGSTRRKYGGTGLGLSISKELAKLLGGTITLESKVGKGSNFTLTLPIKNTVTAIINPDSKEKSFNNQIPTISNLKNVNESNLAFNKNNIAEEIEDDRSNISADDKTILIIEDDTLFAKALLDFTRQKGYKGLVAVRGDIGLELANKYMLSGILLDIQLPVKNGWQVMDELKNNPATQFIPVHIMSSIEAKQESLLKGAIDFIHKPVAFENLHTIFDKREYVLSKNSKKVLIVEDNNKHANALAYYLNTYNVHVEINQTIEESIESLHKNETDCVILEMSVTDAGSYTKLEEIRQHEDLKDIPIIIFTGKNFSPPEELKIKKYADSIVLKTAHSYQRILDEVSLFLHLVKEQNNSKKITVSDKVLKLDKVLKNKTVLLADDDVRNIFAMTKVLEHHHIKVLPALDGTEAIKILENNSNVDIILMDMMMPEMDGYQAIKAIRSNANTKAIPIIAVTAKAMSGDREKCIMAGASDYISKPVDMNQLVSLLRVWLYEKNY